MKRVMFLAILVTMCSQVNAQLKYVATSKETKTQYSITTYSEAVYDRTADKFKMVIRRATIVWKTDRIGRYKEYTMYFPLSEKSRVNKFLKDTWKLIPEPIK